MARTFADIPDDELEDVVEQKQRNDFIKAIRELKEAIKSNNGNNDAVVKAVSNLNQFVNEAMQKINEIKQPNVNVQNDSSKVIAKIEEMKTDICKELYKTNELLEKVIELRNDEVEMIPKKDNWGRITSMKIKTVSSKPKYQA